MTRYHAVFATMRAGGFIEWSADDDAAAIADVMLWQQFYGERRTLAAIVGPGWSMRPIALPALEVAP